MRLWRDRSGAGRTLQRLRRRAREPRRVRVALAPARDYGVQVVRADVQVELASVGKRAGETREKTTLNGDNIRNMEHRISEIIEIWKSRLLD